MLWKQQDDNWAYYCILGTPPSLWTEEEVKDWVLHYVHLHQLQHLKITDFDMTGSQLCKLTKEEFCRKAGKQVGEKMFEDIDKRKKGGLFFYNHVDKNEEM